MKSKSNSVFFRIRRVLVFKYKMLSRYLILALSLVLVVVYQNCSGGFATLSGADIENSTFMSLATTEVKVFGFSGNNQKNFNLQHGESLNSGAITLTMQRDGNLVLQDGGKKILWASNTGGKCAACSAIFQNDGNFVIYNQESSPPKPIFSTGTVGAKELQLLSAPPYLSILAGNKQIMWMAVSPTLEDLFNGNARFQTLQESQEVNLKFTSDVKGIWDQKLPMFTNPNDGAFYAFTRGYLGNDKFNIFLMKSSDGVNFTQVGDGPVFKYLTSDWTVYDPHVTLDTSVQPHRYIMTMECAKDGSFGASLCTSISTTPWLASSWTFPSLVIANSTVRSASTGSTLVDQGKSYMQWTLVNDASPESSSSTSTWATQISDISSFSKRADEGTLILGAEQNTHCTSAWDCNNTDVQDWKKIGNYYYAFYNGANFYRCVRNSGDSGTSDWRLAVRRSTQVLGPYTESTGPVISAENIGTCGISYPMFNQVGHLNYLYYAYYPKSGGNKTMRSLLIWGAGSKSTQAPLPQTPVFGSGRVCSPNSAQPCSVLNGSGAQTCNATGTAYGSCSIISCDAGFVQMGGSCQRAQQVDYEAIVKKAYLDILKRDAEPAGLFYHVDQMKRGVSEAQIRQGIASSPEGLCVGSGGRMVSGVCNCPSGKNLDGGVCKVTAELSQREFLRSQLNLSHNQSIQVKGYTLIMQADRNLVIYDSAGTALWSIMKGGSTCRSTTPCNAVFQNDGNFVVYQGSTAIWSSGTVGATKLIFQEAKPYLRILNSSGTVLWSSDR